jgi:hypothetical protein
MRKVILIVVLIACGFFLGMQAGIQIEKKKIGKWFRNQSDTSSTSNITTRMKAIEWMKKGQVDKAEECLESVVDVELAYLGTTVTDASPLLEDRSNVLNTIKQVKDFREKHPGHQTKPDLNDRVKAAFKLIDR